MKTFKIIQTTIKFIVTFSLLLIFNIGNAQIPSKIDSTKEYILITYEGVEFVGKIERLNNKEIVINTHKVGEVLIPKYTVKSLKVVNAEDLDANGLYIGEEVFSTRYFLTTNGLPIKKGESYIQYSLYGPDIQIGIAKNWSVGISTTWLAAPILVNTKYTFSLDNKWSIGTGIMLGTYSWARSNAGIVVPHAELTVGNRRKNLTFSAGAFIQSKNYIESETTINGNTTTEKVDITDNKYMFSLSGMAKLNNKYTFVFESIYTMPFEGSKFMNLEDISFFEPIELTERKPTLIIIPGIRIKTKKNHSFQIGVYNNLNELVGNNHRFQGFGLVRVLPMFTWYQKF